MLNLYCSIYAFTFSQQKECISPTHKKLVHLIQARANGQNVFPHHSKSSIFQMLTFHRKCALSFTNVHLLFQVTRISYTKLIIYTLFIILSFERQ